MEILIQTFHVSEYVNVILKKNLEFRGFSLIICGITTCWILHAGLKFILSSPVSKEHE